MRAPLEFFSLITFQLKKTVEFDTSHYVSYNLILLIRHLLTLYRANTERSRSLDQ